MLSNSFSRICAVFASLIAIAAALDKSPERFQFATENKKIWISSPRTSTQTTKSFSENCCPIPLMPLSKVRLLSHTDELLKEKATNLEINVIGNEEDNTLTIIDSGIGMTFKEMRDNLGTIARSGTEEFSKSNSGSNQKEQLIGQYGIGFYSAFLVADEVQVISKSHSEGVQNIWTSESGDSYTCGEDTTGERIERGTKIILKLKPEFKEFSQQARLETLITKFSQFIDFPIKLWKGRTVSEEVPLTEEELAEQEAKRLEAAEEAAKKKAEKEAKKAEKAEKAEKEVKEGEEPEEEADEADVDESEETPKEPKTTKTVEKIVKEFVQVNHQKPIWQKAAKDVSKEEYDEFYHAFSKEKTSPLTYSHFNVEGDLVFKGLLYVSKGPEYNPMDPNDVKNKKKLSLYVRRVLIPENLEDAIPSYLGFVTGLIPL